MTKKEVQKRVLQDGKPLAFNKFTWNKKTRTFNSEESDLFINFSTIINCTFNTGSHCTFITGSDCVFNTGNNCMFKTINYCKFNTSYNCVFTTGGGCVFNTNCSCTFDTASDCTFTTSSDCTFKTGSECTFNTGTNCIFDTAYACVFNTGSYSVFNTNDTCLFNTGNYCTFNTTNDCVFETGYDCTFNCEINANIINKHLNNISNYSNNILVLRYRNTNKIYRLDKLEDYKMIYFYKNKKPVTKEIKEVKLIDNQIVIINSTKRFRDYQIYSVQDNQDYFNNDKVFKIVSKKYDEKIYYAHCEHIKKGIEDVNFKIARENYNLSEIAQQIKTKENIINWYDYRLITGACEFGTKEWLDQNNYTTNDTMNIHDFYEKYKEQHPYAFDKFEEFYKEWF